LEISTGLKFKYDATLTINGSNQASVVSAPKSYQAVFSATAGETLSKGDVVYFSAAGTVSKADANGGTQMPNVVGVVLTAGPTSATNPVDVLAVGVLSSVGTSWTVGAPVYLSETAGALTQTAPTSVVVRVGYAASSTDLMVAPIQQLA
jgi:hypothetical protein